MSLREAINDAHHALKQLKKQPKTNAITNFKQQKHNSAQSLLNRAIQRIILATQHDPLTHTLAQQLPTAKPEHILAIIEKLATIASTTEEHKPTKLPPLPLDIHDEIHADMNEIDKCIAAGCYRSSVILSGRVMETALHRKYYDTTGNDLLEKAPGIGLGNLIAKLSEKGIELDPGLPNQIHLINQVRIFSVHTKKTTFTPTKTQAEAIRLYTLDILDKLFKKK